LVRSGAVAVDRHRKALDAKFRHGFSSTVDDGGFTQLYQRDKPR